MSSPLNTIHEEVDNNTLMEKLNLLDKRIKLIEEFLNNTRHNTIIAFRNTINLNDRVTALENPQQPPAYNQRSAADPTTTEGLHFTFSNLLNGTNGASKFTGGSKNKQKRKTKKNKKNNNKKITHNKRRK